MKLFGENILRGFFVLSLIFLADCGGGGGGSTGEEAALHPVSGLTEVP